MLINFSEKYPVGHPRHGQPTDFILQIKQMVKLHTLRDSAARWEEASERLAAVPMHVYTGARSKRATCHMTLIYSGSQKVEIHHPIQGGRTPFMFIDGKALNFEDAVRLSQNDGFTDPEDFTNWMFLGQPPNTRVVTKYILHWTPLRY